MLELRGGIFANGASTAAFVSLMNSAAQAAQTRYLKGKYVEVGEMQNISSDPGFLRYRCLGGDYERPTGR